MSTISISIQKTQLRKKYSALLNAYGDTDERIEISCDNEKFAPIIEKELGLKTRVIHNIMDAYVPFAYCSNETDELDFVYNNEDLSEFELVADFGQGVIVVDLSRI